MNKAIQASHQAGRQFFVMMMTGQRPSNSTVPARIEAVRCAMQQVVSERNQRNHRTDAASVAAAGVTAATYGPGWLNGWLALQPSPSPLASVNTCCQQALKPAESTLLVLALISRVFVQGNRSRQPERLMPIWLHDPRSPGALQLDASCLASWRDTEYIC